MNRINLLIYYKKKEEKGTFDILAAICAVTIVGFSVFVVQAHHIFAIGYMSLLYSRYYSYHCPNKN